MKDLDYEVLRIRMIEQEIARRYPEGKMRCPVHLSIGQEAPAVGLCAALQPIDKMVSTHRGHAHYLAKGGSIKGLIGELYGKSTGCSRGNGGSMHLIDLSVNFWGSTSIVGGTIPVGVGLAFADKIKGSLATTVICLGDAAIEEGVFHEAANFASLHKLNVIFACENNQYSCYTHIKQRQPDRSLMNIAKAHNLRYMLPDHKTETIASYTELARAYAASGAPVFMEIPTYRMIEHCGPNEDDHLNYRNALDTFAWRMLDVVRWEKHHVIKIKQEIEEAFADAETAAWPNPSEVGSYVYA